MVENEHVSDLSMSQFANKETLFAVRHAQDAWKTSKDYGCDMPGLQLTWEGYRFDDNGYIVFLDYEGKVRATVS